MEVRAGVASTVLDRSESTVGSWQVVGRCQGCMGPEDYLLPICVISLYYQGLCRTVDREVSPSASANDLAYHSLRVPCDLEEAANHAK